MMLPVMMNGFGVQSLAKGSALVKSLSKTAALNNERILVIVYLAGGTMVSTQ